MLAEPFEGGPEQRGEETGRAFEGELGCVGHFGARTDAAEGHGVDGDDRLVLPAGPDALTGHELTHDVGQLGLPAEEQFCPCIAYFRLLLLSLLEPIFTQSLFDHVQNFVRLV